MKSQYILQKALMLLDRGQMDRAVISLREAIVQAESDNDLVTLVQSLVCLGDVLCLSGSKSEARSLLEKALTYKRDDDLLAYEYERAMDLLSQI